MLPVMAASSDGGRGQDQIFGLSEYAETYDLPRWVGVVGGKDLGNEEKGSTNINKGDVLLLRTLATDNVTLSFNDTETGSKRIVHISSECQVKFQVLLPFPDFNKTGPLTVYKTVADLLKVCPTYFKANVRYDDPYLPAIVKEGEVFRFLRQIRSVSDHRIYLQCQDAEGDIVELPEECHGDFTAEEDDRAYTIKEILELGCVTRKLRLAKENRRLSLTSASIVNDTEDFYKNVQVSKKGEALQRIKGLPATYNGLITFHKPNMFLAVSPSTNMAEAWRVPLNLDIKVKHFIPEDYETPDGSPVQRMYKLKDLLDTFIEELPVLATLVHYKDMPPEFNIDLEPGDDVIIHKVEREDKLLATSQDLCYCISRKLKGKIRPTLRKAHTFNELKQLRRGDEDILFKIMQDVASDFPVPYSLQAGDCLRIKSFEIKQHKVKAKNKTFDPVDVIHCERMTEKGAYKKIVLPEDLEVYMFEIPSKEDANGYSAADLFVSKPTFPHCVDYLADYTNVWSCLPVCSEISMTTFVTEPMAIASVVPALRKERRCLEAKLKTCLSIPVRHHAMFTVKDCLGFPPGYFKFPDRSEYLYVPVEKISKSAYDDLVRHNDMAYEDYDQDVEDVNTPPESPSSPDSVKLPSKSKKTEKKLDMINKRLSQSLGGISGMFRKKASKSKDDKKERDSETSEETNGAQLDNVVTNQTYGATEMEGSGFSDEEIYETYDFPKK